MNSISTVKYFIMKQKLQISLLAIATMVMLFSCKKDERGNESKAITLNITLATGAVYELDLSAYGDADDLATIATQAVHFDVSEINKSSLTGKYVYKYIVSASPKAGYNGTDKVVLKVYEPDGRPHYEETVITVNFTIQ